MDAIVFNNVLSGQTASLSFSPRTGSRRTVEVNKLTGSSWNQAMLLRGVSDALLHVRPMSSQTFCTMEEELQGKPGHRNSAEVSTPKVIDSSSRSVSFSEGLDSNKIYGHTSREKENSSVHCVKELKVEGEPDTNFFGNASDPQEHWNSSRLHWDPFLLELKEFKRKQVARCIIIFTVAREANGYLLAFCQAAIESIQRAWWADDLKDALEYQVSDAGNIRSRTDHYSYQKEKVVKQSGRGHSPEGYSGHVGRGQEEYLANEHDSLKSGDIHIDGGGGTVGEGLEIFEHLMPKNVENIKGENEVEKEDGVVEDEGDLSVNDVDVRISHKLETEEGLGNDANGVNGRSQASRLSEEDELDDPWKQIRRFWNNPAFVRLRMSISMANLTMAIPTFLARALPLMQNTNWMMPLKEISLPIMAPLLFGGGIVFKSVTNNLGFVLPRLGMAVAMLWVLWGVNGILQEALAYLRDHGAMDHRLANAVILIVELTVSAIAVVSSLSSVGVKISTLMLPFFITTALAGKDVWHNYFAGFFLFAAQPFRPGDTIALLCSSSTGGPPSMAPSSHIHLGPGWFEGVCESVDLRYTVLRNGRHRLMVPNSRFVQKEFLVIDTAPLLQAGVKRSSRKKPHVWASGPLKEPDSLNNRGTKSRGEGRGERDGHVGPGFVISGPHSGGVYLGDER